MKKTSHILPQTEEKSFRECTAAAWRMSKAVRWRMGVSVVIGLVRITASLGFVWVSKQLWILPPAIAPCPWLPESAFLRASCSCR